MTMTIMMINYVDENMTVSMTVTMTKLSWSGDRGEVWADTLENFADALGEAGEVFSWLPFSKIKDTAGRQTILNINLCYKWIYHQVAEYAEIAAELAAAALPWQNPHEFCSKKGKDCFVCHIRIRFCWSVPVSSQTPKTCLRIEKLSKIHVFSTTLGAHGDQLVTTWWALFHSCIMCFRTDGIHTNM